MNTRLEINEFVKCLTNKYACEQQEIQLSTVIVSNDEDDNNIEQTKCCINLVEKISNGLKTRNEIIDITTKNRSLIEYLVKLMKT